MKAAVFFVVFLFSFALTLAYAGLPGISENPGEPGFPVPVPPPPSDDSSGGGGGMGGGIGNDTLPLPGENGSVPGTSTPTEGGVIDPETGEMVAPGEQESSSTGLLDVVGGDGVSRTFPSALVLPTIGFALVIALFIILLVVRKKHKARKLPEKIKKF